LSFSCHFPESEWPPLQNNEGGENEISRLPEIGGRRAVNRIVFSLF